VSDLVWPNAESAANSDPWLVEHHDVMSRMRPRVLGVNFVHGLGEPEARRQLQTLSAVLAESSRWQGYRDPRAPIFLDYQVGEILDFTEPAGRVDRNSAQFPRDGIRLDYARLYAMIDLQARVERGEVHEVWLLADHTDHTWPWETVEVKAAYDERFTPTGRFARFAGNSGEHNAPWLGRSVRTLFVNHARGVGCAMESLGHSLEWMATCGAIPYYERYFREYAMLDLYQRERFDHPPGWVSPGGNVHFMPNGRFHYDLDGGPPVLSTIETWRQRDERAVPWTPVPLERYRNFAPDCMGRWVVYWRQNMPGLDNTARDDDGRPMKNWWPFLFY